MSEKSPLPILLDFKNRDVLHDATHEVLDVLTYPFTSLQEETLPRLNRLHYITASRPWILSKIPDLCARDIADMFNNKFSVPWISISQVIDGLDRSVIQTSLEKNFDTENLAYYAGERKYYRSLVIKSYTATLSASLKTILLEEEHTKKHHLTVPELYDISERIQRGKDAQKALKTENLTREERHSAQQHIDDAMRARETLVATHKGWLIQLAKRSPLFAGSPNAETLDVLIAAGAIGLVKASQTYNSEKGSFTNYSRKAILQQMQRKAIRELAEAPLDERNYKLQQQILALLEESGFTQGTHTYDEIANTLHVGTDVVLNLVNATQSPVDWEESTVQSADGWEITFEEITGSEDEYDLDDQADNRKQLLAYLNILPAEYQKILISMGNLDHTITRTPEQIAQDLQLPLNEVFKKYQEAVDFLRAFHNTKKKEKSAHSRTVFPDIPVKTYEEDIRSCMQLHCDSFPPHETLLLHHLITLLAQEKVKPRGIKKALVDYMKQHPDYGKAIHYTTIECAIGRLISFLPDELKASPIAQKLETLR